MKTVIVLSDGETWATGAYILTLTDRAFKKLKNGAQPCDLDKKDHLMEVYIGITEK